MILITTCNGCNGSVRTVSTTAVTSGVEPSVEAILTNLDQGTAVHVVEVVRRDDLRRVRGTILIQLAAGMCSVGLQQFQSFLSPVNQTAPSLPSRIQ